jgi:hypothetical protein
LPWNQGLAYQLIPFAGLMVAGDVGDLTVWTNKNGRIIVAPKSPPDKPPTPPQIRQRQRFALAMQHWHKETDQTRTDWETLTNRLSLCAVGLNVYISLSLVPDDERLNTMNRQAHLSLPPPPEIPP